MEQQKIKINEIRSKKPGVWFSFEVLKGKKKLAIFETQIDKGYCLDGPFETVYTIYKIIVDKKHQRSGVGSRIIDYCEKMAVDKNLRKLVCWVRPLDPNVSEADLITFYRKNGFRLVSYKQTRDLYAVKDL